jgi:ribose-phosphate pyrophosphokinase
MQIVGFHDYQPQARRLAQALNAAYTEATVHYFPDGESKVTLPGLNSGHLVFVRTLDRPNDKLIELMLAARTARDLGANRLSLVAPYLCYMRQDSAFHHGEAVSQSIVGEFLGSQFDDLLTVDPHLHRTDSLEQAVPNCHGVALTATGLLGDYLAERGEPLFLLGPDAESEQWVKRMADPRGLPHAIAHKERFGDHDVAVSLPERDWRARTVVLVDDVASTGRTLAQAARAVRDLGATRVEAVVVHPLLAGDAESVLTRAGVSVVHSSDSITHASNAVQMAPVLAEGVRHLR